ncbi:MAG: amino acid decarboxylase, partial [Hydrogenoanaerobacterium sp.]
EAALSASEEIPVDKSVGRIAAAVLCSCPPCVPLVMPGEEITDEAVQLLKISGKTNIKVVL